MFRMMLYTQWKWSRLFLLLLVLTGFAIPMLASRSVAAAERWDVWTMLQPVQAWGVLLPMLAGGGGLFLALTAWTADHAGKHVYALSLPIPRWHYALLRFGAGAVLLGFLVLGVLAGALVATVSVHLPPGLRAYPLGLTLRFALAAFVAYGLFFAIAAGTSRTAAIILGALAALLVTQILLSAFGSDSTFVLNLLERLFVRPGPLEVFTGRWMLFDV